MAKTIKYSKVKNLTDKDFKRVVGVKKETFKDMMKVLRKHYKNRKDFNISSTISYREITTHRATRCIKYRDYGS